MKRLENKFIITFASTTAAMAMEKECSVSGAPGRLIPTPTAISAGCGMCWCAELAEEAECRKLLQERNLSFEATYRI